MQKLISRYAFSKKAGVSPAAITKACIGQLSGACVGKRIDAAHPLAVEYVRKKELGKIKKLNKSKNQPENIGKCEIDWNMVDGMCTIQCSVEEIVDCIGVSKDQLFSACLLDKGVELTDYHRKKTNVGRLGLKRQQFKLAMEGRDPRVTAKLAEKYLEGEEAQVRTVTQEELRAAVENAYRAGVSDAMEILKQQKESGAD